MKNKAIYYVRLLKRITFYDQTAVPKSYFSSNLSHAKLVLRFSQIFSGLLISLLAWTVIRIISVRYKVSIYVLKPFRPNQASVYLAMIEPLCRKLQHDNRARHIKILVQPGSSVSTTLDQSYSPHFSLYLDDKKKFTRLVAYLVPKKSIEKIYLDTSYRFDSGWFFSPSKNYLNQKKQVPVDLQKLGIDVQNFVLFVHPSLKYYLSRYDSKEVQTFPQCFIDLANYNEVLLDLMNQGLKIVRVGIKVDNLPESFGSIPIIDYTGEVRDELSEFWLYENCKILISVANGAFWFAKRFERPCIITNSHTFAPRFALSIPMLIINHDTGRLLSFAEMSFRKQQNFNFQQMQLGQNLEFVPNSSLTIKNAVNDTLNFSQGKCQYDEADEKLVLKYLQILEKYEIRAYKQFSVPPISFLKEFSYLLD